MSRQSAEICSSRKMPASDERVRVLVVDDYRDGAEATALYLAEFDFDTRFVTAAREVSRAAAQHAPHIVLLDIRMPEMDGFDVARLLRASPGLQATILIAYTSMPWADIEHQAAAAGFDGYFRKASELSALPQLLATFREASRVPS